MTTDMRHADFDIMPDADSVARKMAGIFVGTVDAHPDRPVRIALSGGSTPKRLFEILASADMKDRVDWSRVELFYGDERHLPAGHKDRNHTMAEAVLLSKLPVAADQVHAVPASGTVMEDARAYEQVLQKAYGSTRLEKDRPLFDLVMLGMGGDGHTASLFPGQPVLEETQKWVSVAQPRTAPYERITLTYPAIASSALVVFLITGESKTEMLGRLRAGDKTIPAGRITSEGKILVLADQAAAGS